MADGSFYGTWVAHVNSIPRLRRFSRGGIAMSYPVFAYTEVGLHLQHFYYAGDQIGPDTVLIGPARVLVTLDYATSDVLDVDFGPFDVPPFEDVEYTLSAEARAARRPRVQHLERLYDQILALYSEPPARELVDEFTETLQQIVPPVLWPYYKLFLGFGARMNP